MDPVPKTGLYLITSCLGQTTVHHHQSQQPRAETDLTVTSSVNRLLMIAQGGCMSQLFFIYNDPKYPHDDNSCSVCWQPFISLDLCIARQYERRDIPA